NQSNTLHVNLGGGFFTDGTVSANLSAPSRSKTGFGTVALDADNDGSLDLVVANGHTDDQPWFNAPMAERPHFFRGLRGGRFELAGSGVSAYFSRSVVGRGVAAGDLDNDGRVDLVVVHRDSPVAILRNVSKRGHWLGLIVHGTKSARTPVGTSVICQAGGRSLVRSLTSGTSYLSSSDPRLWFGLGSACEVERIEVRWPSGEVQTFAALPGDVLFDLTEGGKPLRVQ